MEVRIESQQYISEVGSILRPQEQTGPQTISQRAASKHMDATDKQPFLQLLSISLIRHVKAEIGTVASQILNYTYFFMHTTQFYLEEGACVAYIAEDILFLHVFPGEAEVYNLHWVSVLLETGGLFTFGKFKV